MEGSRIAQSCLPEIINKDTRGTTGRIKIRRRETTEEERLCYKGGRRSVAGIR